LFLLTINFSACEKSERQSEDIHSKIHSRYYTISSYSADCTVTAFTTGGENTYDCTVNYNKDNSQYDIASDDMSIVLTPEKTVISKGGNKIEAVPSDADMYIFVNTFFKSYYEAEDTVVSVGKNEETGLTLLECSCIDPTEFATSMKLWIDNASVLPVRMQIYNKNNRMTSEIIFNNFKFC